MKKKRIIGTLATVGILSLGVVGVMANNVEQQEVNMLIEKASQEVISDYDFRIRELTQNKILLGDERGNLNLDKTLKRQEMVVLLSRLMGVEAEAKSWGVENLTFEDVAKDNWAAPYIAWAKDNNITKGYSEEWFGYNDELTLTQTQIFFLRILGYSEVDMDNASKLAFNSGLMDTVKNYYSNYIIRSDVAIMLYNTLYIENLNGEILADKLGIITSLTVEEKNLKLNMQYFNVEFLKRTEINEEWDCIYISSSNSTLSEKNEDEYKAFVHSIISAIGYKNFKVIDINNDLEIIAYCNAEKRQVLSLEVDGIYNYFNMKETF